MINSGSITQHAEKSRMIRDLVPSFIRRMAGRNFSFHLSLKVIALLFLFTTTSIAQEDRFVTIENKLKEIAATSPGLSEKVELSVNGVSIQEFIRGLATTNNLNVSIDAGLTAKVYNNFSNVTVSDILLFLIKKYDLDVTFVGNIISFTQFQRP